MLWGLWVRSPTQRGSQGCPPHCQKEQTWVKPWAKHKPGLLKPSLENSGPDWVISHSRKQAPGPSLWGAEEWVNVYHWHRYGHVKDWCLWPMEGCQTLYLVQVWTWTVCKHKCSQKIDWRVQRLATVTSFSWMLAIWDFSLTENSLQRLANHTPIPLCCIE